MNTCRNKNQKMFESPSDVFSDHGQVKRKRSSLKWKNIKNSNLLKPQVDASMSRVSMMTPRVMVNSTKDTFQSRKVRIY